VVDDVDETTNDGASASVAEETGHEALVKAPKIMFAVDDATVPASTDSATGGSDIAGEKFPGAPIAAGTAMAEDAIAPLA
jgi:hypothetical protein